MHGRFLDTQAKYKTNLYSLTDSAIHGKSNTNTDRGPWPKSFPITCKSAYMKLHIAPRIRARRLLRLLFAYCSLIERRHVPRACLSLGTFSRAPSALATVHKSCAATWGRACVSVDFARRDRSTVRPSAWPLRVAFWHLAVFTVYRQLLSLAYPVLCSPAHTVGLRTPGLGQWDHQSAINKSTSSYFSTSSSLPRSLCHLFLAPSVAIEKAQDLRFFFFLLSGVVASTTYTWI